MTDLPREHDPSVWGAGAAAYQDNFSEHTGRYADDALGLLGVGPDTRLLDVAAGSGAATFRAVALGAEVLATDFAPGMVELLDRRIAAEGLRATAAVMDAQHLDLPDASFDAAISMFGLMFAPDLDRAGRELRRVIRTGGRAAIGVWANGTNRLSGLVGEAVARVLGTDGPEPKPAPWAHLGDETGMASYLLGVGFHDGIGHRISHEWDFPDPSTFFRSVPTWAVPVQPLFASLSSAQLDAAAAAFGDVVRERAAANGTDAVVVDAIVGIGTA